MQRKSYCLDFLSNAQPRSNVPSTFAVIKKKESKKSISQTGEILYRFLSGSSTVYFSKLSPQTDYQPETLADCMKKQYGIIYSGQQ